MLDWSQVRAFSMELPWDGKSTPIRVQFVRLEESEWGRLLFTPQGDETHWVLREDVDVPRAFYRWETSDEELGRFLRSALDGQKAGGFHFSRCFELPIETRLGYYVAIPGLEASEYQSPWVMLYCEDGEGSYSLNSFGWNNEPEWKTWSNARVESWLWEFCRDPASELHFMIWWWTLSVEEMRCFVEAEIEGCQELKQLMRWVLLQDPLLGQGNCMWDLEATHVWRNSSPNGVEVALSPLMRRWQELLIARFLPLPDLSMNPLPWCVSDELYILLNQKVHLETSSAHDHMEAGLQLLEWSRTNLSREEFADLWGER